MCYAFIVQNFSKNIKGGSTMLFKKIFATAITGTILLGTAFASDAQATDFEINTMEELEAKISFYEKDNTLSEEVERTFIFENTKPEVLNTYIQNLAEEFQETVNNLSGELNSLDGQTVKKEVKTESNGVVSVTVKEEVKQTHPSLNKAELIISNPDAVQLASTATSSQITQSFGDRSYKIDYAFYHLLYPDTHMVLNMFYKLNKSGITMTSTSKGGSYAVFPSSVSGSTKITDSRAEKVGYDVNAQGDFKWTLLGYNGVGISSIDVTIIGTVKLVDLYSNSALLKRSYAVYK